MEDAEDTVEPLWFSLLLHISLFPARLDLLPAVEDSILLLSTRLPHPRVTLCPPQWRQCGCLLGVPSVEGAPLLLVCLQCSPFLFGCPGFVLTEEKFTDNKMEIFCYEKEYSSQIGTSVLSCLCEKDSEA